MTNQLTFPKDLALEMTAQYFSAKNIGQGRELSRGGIDLGAKKNFLSGRLEVNVTASDVLNTMGLRQEITSEGFRAEYQNFYETQIFSVALKYKFLEGFG